MKALQFMSPGVMAVNDIAIPKIAEDEVLLASRSVGICHSDIELLEGRYIIPFQYPVIPGHEWAGEVMEIGKNVTSLKVGDRVVGECVIGQEHFGFSISGAIADFFIAKADWLHKLPENVSWTQGALVEPFSCGYYATVRADNLDASDTVIVFGAGPIGLGVIAASVAKGARVIVAEPTKSDFLHQIQELTKGVGASVVFDASGKPQAMASTLDVAGFRARIVIIGISVGGESPARLGQIQSKELQIRGIIGSPGVWPQTIRFLARTGVDLSKIVTSSFDIAHADQAYQTVLSDKSQIKVHVTNQAS
jgi:L-iditol 2-dehydrogenase